MKIKLQTRIIFSVIAWISVVAWMFFIYQMSADDGETSGNRSGDVVEFIAETVVPDYSSMSESEKQETRQKLSFPVRKLAHVTEYSILGIFLAIAVLLTPRMGRYLRIILPLAIGWMYAVTDEYHQSMVPGRGPSFWDVCIDGIGLTLGVFSVVLIVFIVNKKCFAQAGS